MNTKKRSDWQLQLGKRYFSFKKGFYCLSYNADSPCTMISSLAEFPFVLHDRQKQRIYSDIPVCKGGFYYQQLEEGCWIIYSEVHYHANVAYDLYYKEAVSKGGASMSGYYMLSLNSVQNGGAVKSDAGGDDAPFPPYSWTFFKPKQRQRDLNFKGADCKYITLYFNARWLKANLLPSQHFAAAGLGRFIESDLGNIIWPLTATTRDEVLRQFDLFEELLHIGGQAIQVDLLRLKFATLNLIFAFCRLCREKGIVNNTMSSEYKERFSMNNVEDYLSRHLFERFPGVSFLARQFGVSETKLKTEFKLLFGKPLYRYFQDQQMELAKELILEKQLLIRDIAFKFGFDSPGKFSAAFKKHHGMSPSQLTKQPKSTN